MSSIYIPKLHIYIYIYIYQSYANHKLTACPMLLVTAKSILTGPKTLTVLLEYTDLFQTW